MPTAADANIPQPAAAEQPKDGPAKPRRWRLRPPQKALAAVLAAGLAVPKIDASFQVPKPNTKKVLASLDEQYDGLVKQITQLAKVPQVAPTFKALLYVDRVSERFIPETWAVLPEEQFADGLHRTLLDHEQFLRFLTSTDATGQPLLSSSDAVRVYCSALVASRVFHIPPKLLLCLLLQESRLRSAAISPTGAEGVGQLTSIAIDEMEKLLRRSTRWRERLRVYESTLARLYGDELTHDVLGELLPDLRLPVFSRIDHVERSAVSDDLLRRVRVLLEDKHADLAAKGELLRELCVQLRAGRPLAAEYLPVARAYRIATTELYNVQTGNTFNPETNVAISAMLFRHYVRYPWALQSRRLTLPFSLRCALAVIAYNQGPRASLKMLEHIAETGLLDVDQLSMERLLRLYTPEFVEQSLGSEQSMRPAELYRHFRSVMGCALTLEGQPVPRHARRARSA